MFDSLTNSLEFIIQQTQQNAHILATIMFVPWVIFCLTTINPRLLMLGIIPRKAFGLVGIIFAPLLHANFNHLFFNSIPLLIFSDCILLQGIHYYIQVTAAIVLISGILIWCFAKSGLHIGASGVITGYWALLVSNIYQTGTLTAIIIGCMSLYYFAGILFDVLPGKKDVSWEGHLFGLIAGFITSYLFS